MEILPASAQIDYRISDKLTWAVISGLATAIDRKQRMRQMRRTEEAGLVRCATDGVNRFVFQEAKARRLTSDRFAFFATSSSCKASASANSTRPSQRTSQILRSYLHAGWNTKPDRFLRAQMRQANRKRIGRVGSWSYGQAEQARAP